MKRGITILLTLLIISSLVVPVFAQIQNKSLPTSEDEAKQQLKTDAEKLANVTKSTINEKITHQVELPDNFKPFARLIFGVKSDEKISLNIFMILIVIWFGFFTIMLKASQFFPFFKNPLTRIIFSVVVTCLVSLTGSLQWAASYFYGLASLFKWLQKIPALATAVAIAIVGVIVIAFKILASIIEGKLRKEEARTKGEKAGFGARIAEIFGRMFGRYDETKDIQYKNVRLAK